MLKGTVLALGLGALMSFGALDAQAHPAATSKAQVKGEKAAVVLVHGKRRGHGHYYGHRRGHYYGYRHGHRHKYHFKRRHGHGHGFSYGYRGGHGKKHGHGGRGHGRKDGGDLHGSLILRF